MPSSTSIGPTPIWHKDQTSQAKEPVLFWKPNDDWGFMCQWYMMPMIDSETKITYNCCERYMMYHKALQFNDQKIAAQILKESSPRKQKSLGQKVSGFKDHVWDTVKYDVVVKGNMLKFEQGKARGDDKFVFPPMGKIDWTEDLRLKELLLSTRDRELVEASPFDRIWGIGYRPDEAHLQPKVKWGKNLLGKALMEVRSRLAESVDESDAANPQLTAAFIAMSLGEDQSEEKGKQKADEAVSGTGK